MRRPFIFDVFEMREMRVWLVLAVLSMRVLVWVPTAVAQADGDPPAGPTLRPLWNLDTGG